MSSVNCFGSQWKAARERVGLTQLEVAEFLGYGTGQFISNVESGRCRFPMKQLPKILKLYRLDLRLFMNMILKEEEQLLRAALGISSRSKATSYRKII